MINFNDVRNKLTDEQKAVLNTVIKFSNDDERGNLSKWCTKALEAHVARCVDRFGKGRPYCTVMETDILWPFENRQGGKFRDVDELIHKNSQVWKDYECREVQVVAGEYVLMDDDHYNMRFKLEPNTQIGSTLFASLLADYNDVCNTSFGKRWNNKAHGGKECPTLSVTYKVANIIFDDINCYSGKLTVVKVHIYITSNYVQVTTEDSWLSEIMSKERYNELDTSLDDLGQDIDEEIDDYDDYER